MILILPGIDVWSVFLCPAGYRSPQGCCEPCLGWQFKKATLSRNQTIPQIYQSTIFFIPLENTFLFFWFASQRRHFSHPCYYHPQRHVGTSSGTHLADVDINAAVALRGVDGEEGGTDPQIGQRPFWCESHVVGWTPSTFFGSPRDFDETKKLGWRDGLIT